MDCTWSDDDSIPLTTKCKSCLPTQSSFHGWWRLRRLQKMKPSLGFVLSRGCIASKGGHSIAQLFRIQGLLSSTDQNNAFDRPWHNSASFSWLCTGCGFLLRCSNKEEDGHESLPIASIRIYQRQMMIRTSKQETQTTVWSAHLPPVDASLLLLFAGHSIRAWLNPPAAFSMHRTGGGAGTGLVVVVECYRMQPL